MSLQKELHDAHELILELKAEIKHLKKERDDHQCGKSIKEVLKSWPVGSLHKMKKD